MKKIMCIIAFFLSAEMTFAQLYLRANIGYNLPVNSQSLESNYRRVYDDQTGQYVTSEEAVDGSFGSGMSINLGVGAAIKGSLGYDVELSYLMGKEYSSEYYYSSGTYIEQTKSTMSSNSFQIAPTLTFVAGTGSIQPYTRMGPVIGITKLKSEVTNTDTYSGVDESYEYEYTGGVNLGFKGVLGVTFNGDRKLQFFGEASFISMAAAPKDGKITSFTVDGEDALDTLPKEQKSFELKDEVTNDEPYTQLRQKFSMGSIGIQVGVKYMLK